MIALISWPISEKNIGDFYINFGEIYDKNIRDNQNILDKFAQELTFLYPLSIEIHDKLITCRNIEDIYYFQTTYKLTHKIRLVGTTKLVNVVCRTPCLYNLKSMRPLYTWVGIQATITDKKNLCIILPYPDCVTRGKIVANILKAVPTFLVVVGGRFGKNIDSTSTLLCRHLLTRGIPKDRIYKYKYSGKPQCILDVWEMMSSVCNDINGITILCSSEDISMVNKAIRFWKAINRLPKCPVNFYTE